MARKRGPNWRNSATCIPRKSTNGARSCLIELPTRLAPTVTPMSGLLTSKSYTPRSGRLRWRRLFARWARQGEIAERKKMIDCDHKLPVSRTTRYQLRISRLPKPGIQPRGCQDDAPHGVIYTCSTSLRAVACCAAWCV